MSTTSRWRVESQMSESLESRSRLYMDKIDPSQSGLYACEADSSQTSATNTPILLEAQTSPDKLRRLFGLIVNGE